MIKNLPPKKSVRNLVGLGRVVISLLLILTVASCASTPPPEKSSIDRVEKAIKRAVDAGAEQHASVELRFARERLDFVKNTAIPEGDYQLANWRLREAELNAELAYLNSRAEVARNEENKAADEVQRLQLILDSEFGDRR